MDKSLAICSKQELFRVNDSFIAVHGSFFNHGFLDYDDSQDGYLSYIVKELGLKSVRYDEADYLLAVIREQQLQHAHYNMGVSAIEDIVMDALKITAQRYARQIKKGRGNPLDVIVDFKAAKRVLQGNPEMEANCNILGYAEIELVLLKIRQKFVREKEEEQKRLREEQKALKELKREKELAEKDAAKAQAAIEKNEAALAKVKTEAQVKKLQAQIEELKIALQRAEERRDRAISMAQQTRCGYVYVISNIGSFGAGIYKIGMTRRITPTERVYELGNASVPFRFDIHAMIYTEDAPGLESALHRKFEKFRVNTENWRKEYFKVPLEDIRKTVEDYGIYCQWSLEPKAEQWRLSQQNKRNENGSLNGARWEYDPFEDEEEG